MQAAKRMGAREARNNFSDLIGSVHYGHETVIVERSGKPMVAVIPVALYEQLIAERENRFHAVDELLARMPQYPEDEVEADIAEAIAAVRAAKRFGNA
jgi:prevent-host-death family protein